MDVPGDAYSYAPGKPFHDMEKRTRTRYGEVPDCYISMLTDHGFDTDRLIIDRTDGRRGYWWHIPPPRIKGLSDSDLQKFASCTPVVRTELLMKWEYGEGYISHIIPDLKPLTTHKLLAWNFSTGHNTRVRRPYIAGSSRSTISSTARSTRRRSLRSSLIIVSKILIMKDLVTCHGQLIPLRQLRVRRAIWPGPRGRCTSTC